MQVKAAALAAIRKAETSVDARWRPGWFVSRRPAHVRHGEYAWLRFDLGGGCCSDLVFSPPLRLRVIISKHGQASSF